MGKVLPLLFLAYIVSILNTWKLDISGKEGYVIHNIVKSLIYTSNVNLFLVGYTILFLVRGTISKKSYWLLDIFIKKLIKLNKWVTFINYHIITRNYFHHYIEGIFGTVKIIINNKFITVCRFHVYYHASFNWIQMLTLTFYLYYTFNFFVIHDHSYIFCPLFISNLMLIL